ncbi:SDR family NAD(P)-dependent oxidoreductase [Actinomadura darangshiensis]|uniref:SDR family NAD(P)-dependent oxidoreductase n=1 Tax=Actinomadura darangshiensis TaxID=705336 RepID=A0A4R5BY27_9ACTN|nr:SDR family NAD(P)-dependent oxidoreductase [Actinomadura darangshiensis]TDD91119.1 SDR family NAD(P)-dependent oxidoreductase [Actinomadura darangshiensis]
MADTKPVALVTGASRGIGRRTALALAAAGHDVAFTARTVGEGTGRIPPRHGTAAAIPVPGSLERTKAEIEELGARALPVQMDLLDRRSVTAAAEAVLAAWGRVDVLVNNAVAHIAGTHERFLDLDLAVAEQTITGNYLNQIALLQAVLPAMVAQGGGTIIDLCSGSATSDPPGPPGDGGWGVAYSASKAAFGRLAGAINAEYLDHGVRAFNLDPGFVVTEAGAARGGLDTLKDRGFEPTPEEAPAAAAAWLVTAPEADTYLGKVIWTPKLVADHALLR